MKNPKILDEFIQTVAALRDPESGCPWDLEQTHKTLRPYLLEETHEVLETIDSGNDEEFCDELGDLLLQVVLHAQIASERDAFDLSDVIDSVNKKMIRRHPHVFGDVTANTSEAVLKNWEQIKSQEKPEPKEKLPETKRLKGIPSSLPSLTRAQRIGEKAASVSFDWENLDDVFFKVKEELLELEEQIRRKELEHELGDLLFSLSQLARWLGVNAEDSLRTTCERFIARFRGVEEKLESKFNEHSAEQLEALWQKVKVEQS
ncbi:UNVERIFIED_CONTAM: hypothetical protein GTU68_067511 [Idotea baltica]|nr:hypothetical protein [Idotea baltica]